MLNVFGCQENFHIGGIKSWIQAGSLAERTLYNKHKRLIHPLWLRCSSINSWLNFSREEPVIALILTNAALSWVDSILLKNDLSEGWS